MKDIKDIADEVMVQITLKEYESLLKTERILEQLEINGVDNWQGYGCMCHDTGDESCVFCEDD